MTWFNLKILQAYIEKPKAVLISQTKKTYKNAAKINKFVKENNTNEHNALYNRFYQSDCYIYTTIYAHTITE